VTTFESKTASGWGSPVYTAPEQWQDFKRTDVRADIYSLGILIWDLLSPSWPPFDRSSTMLPSPLDTVVRKATERAREHRQQSVSELIRDFESAILEIAQDNQGSN